MRYEHSTWSEWRDLNPRPLGPEPSALPAALHPDVVWKSSAKRIKETRSGRAVARPLDLEAPPRFELGHQDFADPCLTTWLWRRTLLFYCPRPAFRTGRRENPFTIAPPHRNPTERVRCGEEGQGSGTKESRLKGGVPEWGGFCPDVERVTRLELATSTLARWRSTR